MPTPGRSLPVRAVTAAGLCALLMSGSFAPASWSVFAQTPPPGSAAALNAEAKRISSDQAEKSAEIARHALLLARAAGDPINAAEALHNLAVAQRNLGRYDLAADFAQQSAGAYASAGARKGEAQGYNTLGLVASDRGDYPRALEYHHKALAIRLAIDDREGLSYSYNNLGNMYRNVQDYPRAIENHFKALDIKKQLGDQSSLAFSYANLGTVYSTMGDVPKALESLREALRIRQGLGEERYVASTYNAIGLALARSDPRGALEEFRKALAIRERLNDRRGLAGTLANIGDAQRRLGRADLAVAALARGLAVADEIRAPVLQIEIYEHLAAAEAARGNFRVAYDWHQKYSALKDLTFNQENSDRLNRLNAAYEAAQREQQIALLAKEGELQRAELYRQRIAGAAGALLVGALVLLYVHRRRSERRYRQQALELQNAIDTARTLRGLLPICASCKKIRDDRGAWQPLERYITARSDADFTHGVCPTCSDDILADV
jgi:tetratricopeptide (TPR) repeat protein